MNRLMALLAAPLLVLGCSNNNNGNGSGSARDAGADSSLDAAGGDAAATDASNASHGDAGTDGSEATVDGSDAAALSDGQIVGVIETLNTGEIQEALLATGDSGDDAGETGPEAGIDAGPARSSDPAVLAFAEMMITHHSQSNTTVAGFGIAAASSTLETMLLSAAQTTIAQLRPLSGASFDLAYAQSQVTGHQSALSVVMNQLLPAAQGATLKMYLQTMLVPVIQAHLAAAQALVATLRDAGPADAGGE